MVTLTRWRKAQTYERGFWEDLAQQIATGSVSRLDWYKWRCQQLADRLRELGCAHLTEGDAHVVEVGCGPTGILPFFQAAERVAVDPLDRFYATNPILAPLRGPAVDYREGVAERLPCESNRYDLAIMENCIDHVQDVQAVMDEFQRVLKPNGVLYLTVNARTSWGYLVHRILSRLVIDPGHPYSFTPERVRALIESRFFRVIGFEVGSYPEARRADVRSPDIKTRLKGLLGVSEFVVAAVARRLTGPLSPPA